MTMTPVVRKIVLTAHIVTSVGWLGAVVGFLGLNVVGLAGKDLPTARAAYLAMEAMTLNVLVPLSLASVLIGLVNSMGTPWGLFRHYWVVVKLLITVFATIILLTYTETMSAIAGLAAETTMSAAELRKLGTGPLLHASGGLVVLLVATTLSVFKPRGLTPYGWRRQQEHRRASKRSGQEAP